ncbi:MAG: hypothetical protein MAG453_00009 [Calditrichaeota bacterium]|nr:hypothetical protein [Calditrichota bacterium]
MNWRNVLLVVLAFALVAPGWVSAQEKVGTTGVNFLKIGPSSRGVALADAFLPIADDASTLWYNPGGLVNVDKPQLMLSHLAFPAETNYDFLGYVYPLPALGAAAGAQVFGLYTGDMDETTPERPYGTGRTFTASDFAAGVSYAQRLTDKFSVGSTVKYLQENLADEVARGWSVDVGTFYDTGWKSLTLAMIISNFGPDMEFITTPFPLPIVFKFGASGDLWNSEQNRLTVALEGIHPNDNREEVHIGFEYAFQELAFLRIGRKFNGWERSTFDAYEDDPEKNNPYLEYPVINEGGGFSWHGMSFGGGVYLDGIGLTVDYAYANYGFFGDIHRFSLMYEFD